MYDWEACQSEPFSCCCLLQLLATDLPVIYILCFKWAEGETSFLDSQSFLPYSCKGTCLQNEINLIAGKAVIKFVLVTETGILPSEGVLICKD